MSEHSTAQLWPDESVQVDSVLVPRLSEPDLELAVILLAAGCSHSVVKDRSGFRTVKEASRFARDPETVVAVKALAGERANRIGHRSLVRLERLLAAEHSDLRATVLAVRTGLEVSGFLRKDIAPPIKQVSELSVSELTELIDATRKELDNRITNRGLIGHSANLELEGNQ